jgi:hypothetical protein
LADRRERETDRREQALDKLEASMEGLLREAGTFASGERDREQRSQARTEGVVAATEARSARGEDAPRRSAEQMARHQATIDRETSRTLREAGPGPA